MEFKLSTDLATVSKNIEFNHDELKRELSASLQKYQGLVVTEDAIPEARSDRAKLNKLKEALSKKRIEIKKAYMVPCDVFEAKIKELTAMIDEPISAIDTQIKAYEDEKKAVKRHEIETYYSEAMGEFAGIYPLSLTWSDKWLNSTVKLSDVQKSIDEIKAKIGRDTEAIRALKSSNEAYLLDVYAKTLDVSAAIAEQKRFEERAARQKQIDVINRATEQQAAQIHENESVTIGARDDIAPEPQPEPLIKIDFRIWATESQVFGLKDYLKQNNIKFGRVK